MPSRPGLLKPNPSAPPIPSAASRSNGCYRRSPWAASPVPKRLLQPSPSSSTTRPPSLPARCWEWMVATACQGITETGMAKARSSFVCSECGGTSAKWLGKCPHCEAWNTLTESLAAAVPAHRFAPLAGSTPIQELSDIEARELPRQPTGIAEFDRVLGGGLVPGSVVLIGGDPGIGKSTLLLQALVSLAKVVPVLYVTGEESAEQVALRARRLDLPTQGTKLLAEIRLEAVMEAISVQKPAVAVIDSIQTLYS